MAMTGGTDQPTARVAPWNHFEEAALDTRIRMCLHSEGEGLPWFVSSGWSRRTEELFELAGEVATKIDR